MTRPEKVPRPRLRDDLVIRQVEGQFLVYDPVEDVTALVNESAALVMDLCDGTRTQDEIALEVARVFGKSVDAVRADVNEACRDFTARGLFASDFD